MRDAANSARSSHGAQTVMRLRQLDDSDSCVFIYDDPSGTETFAVGIYVDNLQIVYSAELNSDGDAVDQNSYYAKFMRQLRKDWDIVDEGPMEDLLGIECNTNPDGSITLHQNKYINSMINRFFTPAPTVRVPLYAGPTRSASHRDRAGIAGPAQAGHSGCLIT